MCYPNWSEIDCGTKENPNFISSYECLGNPDVSDQYQLEELKREARISFFSGHASISWSCATFVVLYLQLKLKHVKSNPLVIYLMKMIQYVSIALALGISYSRISDDWHHPSDVAVGSLVGIVCQLWNFLYLM